MTQIKTFLSFRTISLKWFSKESNRLSISSQFLKYADPAISANHISIATFVYSLIPLRHITSASPKTLLQRSNLDLVSSPQTTEDRKSKYPLKFPSGAYSVIPCEIGSAGSVTTAVAEMGWDCAAFGLYWLGETTASSPSSKSSGSPVMIVLAATLPAPYAVSPQRMFFPLFASFPTARILPTTMLPSAMIVPTSIP